MTNKFNKIREESTAKNQGARLKEKLHRLRAHRRRAMELRAKMKDEGETTVRGKQVDDLHSLGRMLA